MVIYSSKQVIIVESEKMNKKPIEYAKNAIEFMNGLSEDEVKKEKVQDRISVMTWARKVVKKYHHLYIVQEKVDVLAHQVKLFIEMFDSPFKKGIPFF